MKKVTAPKIELRDFEEIASELDLDRIADAIVEYRDGEPKLTLQDWEDAKECVWTAGETWLPRDLYDLEVTAIEQKYRWPLPKFEKPLKMILDLEGTTKGSIPSFDQFPGQKVIIDWKTRDGALDTAWKDRNVDSWQWQIYSRARSASLFVYRGVSRRRDLPRWEKTRELLISVPASNAQEVDEYLEASLGMRKYLVDNRFQVWPRSKPNGCKAYGKECPFYDSCMSYVDIPRAELEDAEMSYTSLQRFFLCPERHRRGVIMRDAEDSDETWFGVAFHRGVAEMWSQAYKLPVGAA